MAADSKDITNNMLDFLQLNIGSIWSFFLKQSFAFWMICGYLFFEYVRPQSIIKSLDILPWSQIFIMLSALGWIINSKKGKVVFTSIYLWMAVFYVVILLSSYFAYRPEISYLRLANFYTWLIIFYLISLIVTSEKQLFIYLLIFLVASFKLSFFGARTWALRGFAFTDWGLRGPPGFFTNSGELAIQMAVFFGISYYFYAAVKPHVGKKTRWLLASFPITAAMTILGASSRGAQVALIIQAYFIFLHGKISIRSLLSIAIVLGAIYYFLPNQQVARFETIGEDRTSIQRMNYWKRGWEMMQDYPGLGVGYYNFPSYFTAHYPGDLLYDQAELAHNIFIQVGADLGFTGLFVYLILIILGFTLPAKTRKILIQQGRQDDWRIPISKGLSIGFLGFVIGGQFVSVVYYPYMWIHLAFCHALLNTTSNTDKSNQLKAQGKAVPNGN